MQNIITSLLLSLLYAYSAGASPLSQIPDYIPLEDKQHVFRPPATDLIYNNKLLTIQEIRQGESQESWDISELEPQPSQIWRDEGFPPPPDLDVRQTGETFAYLDTATPNPPDLHQLSVKQRQPDGSEKIFTVFLGKRVHNILLRAAILKKLGYSVPPIGYLKSFRLDFTDHRFQLTDYIGRKIPQDTVGDPKRWIKNIEQGVTKNVASGEDTFYWKAKDDATYLEMQDAIIIAKEPQYNLALGITPPRMDQGRRIFRSLKVPYALTDVPESVNIFSWNLGRIVDAHLHLPYLEASNLKPDLADIHWMARRVAALTRKDFEEIVQEAYFPKAVSAVLVEKLISRRNDLVKKLELQSSVKQEYIPFFPKISLGKDLKKGKLLKENWPGYASRFAFGDPDSPLSRSEVKAYFKSEFISNVLSSLVTEINESLPIADVLSKGQEAAYNKTLDTLVENFKTGQVKEVPFGTWSAFNYSANIIASRNIVVGQYLGTNNRIQLADSIGFALEAGVFIGSYGDLPKDTSFSAGANAFYSRVYTHLTPVQSIKKSLETPFKNLLVPMIQNKYSALFDELLDGDFSEIDIEEKQKKIKEVMSIFHENMENGESFIVSNRFGAYGRLNASLTPGELLRIYGEIRATETIISRFHIYKENKESIHIYDDFGNALRFSFGFGINLLDVSILQISFRNMVHGSASIDHYKLNIDPDMEKNEKIMDNIHALRSALFGGSLELLRTWQNPWKIRHKLSEKVNTFNLLHITSKRLKSQSVINVEKPDGKKGKIIRANMGGRVGKDPTTLVLNTATSLLNEWLKSDISLKIQNNSDPGNTFYGRSEAHQSILEAIIDEEQSGESILPYVRLEHRWRGWEIDKENILRRIKEINKQFGYTVFDPKKFNDVSAMQLYSFVVEVNLYEKAIHNIMNTSWLDTQRLFKAHKNCWNNIQYVCNPNPAGNMIAGKGRGIRPAESFRIMQRKYHHSILSGDFEAASNYAIRAIDFLSGHMRLDGLAVFAGGMENLYVQSVITGFREGEEYNTRKHTILGNSRGRVSSKMVRGPTDFLLGISEMSYGEFFALWLLDFL